MFFENSTSDDPEYSDRIGFSCNDLLILLRFGIIGDYYDVKPHNL